MEDIKEKYNHLIKSNIEASDIGQQIKYLRENFKEVCFSTSFSYEDQLITYLLKEEPFKIFTLDTGRLFEETYDTWNRTLAAFKVQITAFYPNQDQIKDFVSEKGPDSFYCSVKNRKQCCYIRKVVPLKKALEGQEIWITGLRAEHSPDRNKLTVFEWDEENQLIKFHPLLHWKTEEVLSFIKQKNIPYNPLHNKGYVSIGCAPCTRPIQEGESFRAGRWWWEDQSKKECGLHLAGRKS